MMSRCRNAGLASVLALIAGAGPLAAEEWRSSYTLFGTPGLVEMPTAGRLSDGTFATSFGTWGVHRRTTTTFQMTPRLTASFRYAGIRDFFEDGSDNWDRSFDVAFRLMDETKWTPAISVGLRDFIGTGLYSSEYVVATKTFGLGSAGGVAVTGGIGWGGLATKGGRDNPLSVFSDKFSTRPKRDFGRGGEIESNQWFRGDAALFGGIEWQPNERLSLKAEYSSDSQYWQVRNGVYEPKSPYNFGISYRPNKWLELQATWMHGNELGFGATLALDPYNRYGAGGLEAAPSPIKVRPQGAVAAASWTPNAQMQAAVSSSIASEMAKEGLSLKAMELTASRVRIRYENDRYRAEAQAMGRLSRILAKTMPFSVETFVLEREKDGMALSSVTIRRSDLERLENAPFHVATSFDRAVIASAGPDDGLVEYEADGKRFMWGIMPYWNLSFFDPEEPVRYSYGVAAVASYDLGANFELAGQVRYMLGGTADKTILRYPNQTVPVVRTDSSGYNFADSPQLTNLTLSHYARLGNDIYSYVSIGYLERMYGGVYGEVLWKPVDSRLAIGGSLAYVRKRDYEGLGFQDYDVVTGHVTGTYQFDNGFEGTVSVGRYLAGDWGATVGLDRTFANGWKVGGYFTLTDVPFDEYGEGSFDKGVRVVIPLDWVIGRSTQEVGGRAFSSLTRDGGSRLQTSGNLYGKVVDSHRHSLEDSWGRFWR